MRPEIPLEILGLLGPILSWVEEAQAQALPKDWRSEPASPFADLPVFGAREETAASFQERSWLLRELPTYSLDNIDEIVAFSRSSMASKPAASRWQPPRRRVAPPRSYDLCRIFNKLEARYLAWNGGKVCIQAGRMVELHELGLRLPLSFVVRHAHARAVAAGEQALRDVAALPESISLLPSNSHGLRTVIRRGLSEGHLHLNSIHATEIAWADHLLKPVSRKPRDFEIVEWRLIRLGRAAARILALATALCRGGQARGEPARGEQAQLEVENARLLQVFDALYFASSSNEIWFQESRFEDLFDAMVARLEPRALAAADRWHCQSPPQARRRMHPGPRECRLGLLYWLDPWRRTHHWLAGETQSIYRKLTTPLEREECLSSLHLASHLELVKARFDPSERDDGREEGEAEPFGTASGRFLHRAFFRYLVCQTHHWQLAVQQGRTTGLRRFKLFFDSNQRYPIEAPKRDLADSVLKRARAWRGLRVLEGRIAPPRRSAKDLMPWLEAFAAETPDERVEKMGLVIHFIKRHPRKPVGPGGLNQARYADLRSEYREQAFRLFHILERPSLATPFIVGIDAANLELATPPEVFAPVFRYLRDRPIALRHTEFVDLDALGAGGTIRQVVERRRLGMTYHVGEEFRHLLSGLRAIDEVLEFLAPQPGDRIGHGIALGLDPAVWVKQLGGQTLVPKQEWLDTLVWLHHFLGTGDDLLGRLQVEGKIEQLGRELYLWEDKDSKRVITPLLMRDVWLLRQLDPAFLQLQPGPRPAMETRSSSHGRETIKMRPIAGDDSAAWRWNRIMKSVVDEVIAKVGRRPPVDLLERYWYSPKTRSEGERLILIDMEKDAGLWLEVCRRAQRLLQDRVAENQVAVEVNPSANRVIGPMSRFSEHHIFDLTLDEQREWKRRLRVTVNTDNPGTANTSLTHEYYLLGEALMSSGTPEAEVVEWLDWLRKSGEDSTFVRQLPPPGSQRMRSLRDRLRQRRRPLREFRDPAACLAELWRMWPTLKPPRSKA